MKNKINRSIITLILVIVYACNVEPYDGKRNIELINKNSELFNLLKSVTTKVNNPTEDIVCIDFIYPFEVFIYNSNREIIGRKFLSGDDEFSTFLGVLPANQAISISYPISTKLSDGSTFSVNNNAELKIAIDSCSRPDIISYCNGLFAKDNASSVCIWTVPYIVNQDNTYASGFFESNFDGTLHFTYNDEVYNGTWVFLFVDDKLHMNINLEGNTPVAQYWNIDRKIEVGVDEIKIISTSKNIVLRKKCESIRTYQIGATGQAGGIVFYDKGFYSMGWRYMEVATSDLGFLEWGCNGSTIQNASSDLIGKGLLNSVSVANFHDNLVNYYGNPSICNPLNNGTVVAQKALTFNEIYSDWFLPSHNELQLMYQNLHAQLLGGFTNSKYWSSTQIDGNNVKVIDFSNGNSISNAKIPAANTIKARAMRYF
jgi:hypothetical protein